MTLLHGAAGTKVAILTVMAAAFQPRRPWVAIRAWTWKHVRASMDDLPMAREELSGLVESLRPASAQKKLLTTRRAKRFSRER